MTPPTPMQSSYTSFEREQGSYEEAGRRMECERKNNHRKDEAIFGDKLQCGFQTNPERSKRRERAQYFRNLPNDMSFLVAE